MLTRKQQELLLFIDRRLKQGGVSPSFDEMKDALGLKSKSGIHRLISGLEERGFIRRLPHRARALEVVKLPDGVVVDPPVLATVQETGVDRTGPRAPAAEATRHQKPAFRPQVIDGDLSGRRGTPGKAAEVAVRSADIVELPLIGKIAAGTPIEALRDHSRTADIPASMLGGGEHYALQVEGDSMIEAGILDGDTVVIERCDRAESGTIVVALIEDSEVTLKRLRKKGHAIALEPANRDYETRIFRPEQVEIQGRLIGLLRRY